jgi:hypothetical protein
LLVAVCAEWHSARCTTVGSLIAMQGMSIAKHHIALNVDAQLTVMHGKLAVSICDAGHAKQSRSGV